LPQNNSLAERLEREAQLDIARIVYAYDTSKATGLDLPVATLAAAMADSTEHLSWFAGWMGHAIVSTENTKDWEKKYPGTDQFTVFADYEKMFVRYPVPKLVDNDIWQGDGFFASERLAGVNPIEVNLVSQNNGVGIGWDKLQPKLSPTILKAQFDGQTIVDLLQQDKLYVTDFERLQGAIPVGNYQLAPLALYVKRDGFPGLLPLAVQLTQNPDDPYVYLAPPGKSATTDYTWLMAKTYLQCADINVGQIWSHLGGTHFLQTSFAVSMHRRLALQHPLHRLLAKHYVGLIGTCEIAYQTLLPPGKLFDQLFAVQRSGGLKLINDAYAKWTFDNWEIPESLRKRGVDDPTRLPYYPYRDDALVIWNRLSLYIEDYVALYYGNDDAVVKDYELQGWAKEVSRVLGVNVDGVNRFPPSIDTRAHLHDVMLRLIWAAGPQHAAVNYPLVEFGTFVPNAPGTMVNPIAGALTETTLVDLLPNKSRLDRNKSGVQVQVGNSLADFWYDQLLDYHLCEEDGSEAIVRKHFLLLNTEDREKIVANNSRWSGQPGLLDYPYLLPENITNSTSA
jgi:arachidonate 15-lipoxygenase